MGGYSGESWVRVVVNAGMATLVDIGEDSSSDLTNAFCEYALKQGQLHLVANMQVPVAAAPAAPTGPRLGVVYQPTQIGVVIMTVAPGSTAERAGLKVGNVISAVNGKSLAGMGPVEMTAAVRPTASTMTYSIIGAPDVKVTLP
ncbi:PDZ domain-containing protein [Sphingomonas paeninsulae]|uniref:PDZ domain-containing protein n=2 Tax=Sphingomonas paeninsulae TaxID=2319844 RepID=A0A494TED2_SPHPE|nr:PDZ domain-containing protein [Sphingomonas paeninsulae]